MSFLNKGRKECVYMDFSYLKKEHFKSVWPVIYKNDIWVSTNGSYPILYASEEIENNSWSTEIEKIHEEPTKTGWIDVYERARVMSIVSPLLDDGDKLVVEFGASAGYMIGELRKSFPHNTYVATDLMADGLLQSYKKSPDIMHICCDFSNAPFEDNSIDFIYALNVLEHIEDDVKTISECFRTCKPGGHVLFVVPRGDKLYDYFDEMLFHKRRYAKGELNYKCRTVGFRIENDFHFAWLCYPAFWIKKKWNRYIGKKLTKEEKMKRVKLDIDNAMASPLAIGMMHIENLMSKIFRPTWGIREFILCTKEE